MIWVDAHLSPALARWITAEFQHPAQAARDLGLRLAKDAQIFTAARQPGIIVLTKDSDFVELVERLRPPPQVLWLTWRQHQRGRLAPAARERPAPRTRTDRQWRAARGNQRRIGGATPEPTYTAREATQFFSIKAAVSDCNSAHGWRRIGRAEPGVEGRISASKFPCRQPRRQCRPVSPDESPDGRHT